MKEEMGFFFESMLELEGSTFEVPFHDETSMVCHIDS